MIWVALGVIVVLWLMAGLLLAIHVSQRFMRTQPTLYAEDGPGFSTYVSFRPLDISPEARRAGERPFFSVFAEKLTRHGVHINTTSGVGNAHRASVTWRGCRFQVTMGRVKETPELWLLTIDQRFRQGLSAPHDTEEVREFLSLVRRLLLEMEIGTVRWHKRQDWEDGNVDNYTYKPC